MPAKNLNEEAFIPSSVPSIEIFTGTRWVTLVKLPDALLGGMSENCEAVLAPMSNIFPVKVTS